MPQPEFDAEAHAWHVEHDYQTHLPPEPVEEEPPRRLPPDVHDAHRCTPVDPTDPWSEAACVKPW